MCLESCLRTSARGQVGIISRFGGWIAAGGMPSPGYESNLRWMQLQGYDLRRGWSSP